MPIINKNEEKNVSQNQNVVVNITNVIPATSSPNQNSTSTQYPYYGPDSPKKYCQYCGETIPRESVYCELCGKKQEHP